jgi:hypothetical protein
MHRLRTVAVIAVAAAVATSVPAFAGRPPARKPVCKLVTDPPGDATFPTDPVPSNDDSLDIVSGDVASSATAVTAVLRLKGNPPVAPGVTGYFMALRFQPPGPAPIYLGARYDVVGNLAGQPVFEWGMFNPQTGSSTAQANTPDVVAGSYNSTTHEMRISVKVKSLAGMKVAPGQKFTNLSAQIKAWGPPYFGQYAALQADAATSTSSYVAGWPSCVKPAFP